MSERWPRLAVASGNDPQRRGRGHRLVASRGWREPSRNAGRRAAAGARGLRAPLEWLPRARAAHGPGGKMAAVAARGPVGKGRDISLAALQRHDPYINRIVDVASQVALYTFGHRANEWVRAHATGSAGWRAGAGRAPSLPREGTRRPGGWRWAAVARGLQADVRGWGGGLFPRGPRGLGEREADL